MWNKVSEIANIDYEESFLDPISETRKERIKINLKVILWLSLNGFRWKQSKSEHSIRDSRGSNILDDDREKMSCIAVTSEPFYAT